MHFTVKVVDAIAALLRFQAEHVAELEEATLVWREKVDEALGRITQALLDEEKLEFTELNALQHQPPVDNRELYKKYIGGFRATLEAEEVTGSEDTEPTVAMTVDEYDQVFNDNWHWRVLSKMTNNSYFNGG